MTNNRETDTVKNILWVFGGRGREINYSCNQPYHNKCASLS